jgi:hypothetical protein
MPSTVRQRQQQRRQNAKSAATSPTADPHLEFISDRQYNPPLLGIQRSTGQPVSILERGNTAGMSATWLVASPTGIPMILSLTDVQLTGSTTGLIPPLVSQLEAMFENVKFDEQ